MATEPSWTARAEQANRAARFLPRVDDDTHPMIEVAGVQAYVYLVPDQPGMMRVSLWFDEADEDLHDADGNVHFELALEGPGLWDVSDEPFDRPKLATA